MLASLLVDPEQPGHRLDTVALLHLNYKMIPLSDLIGEGEDETSIDTVPLAQVTSYASEDTDVVLRLYHHLLPKLEEMGMTALVRDIESPLAPIIAEIEFNGIVCDPEELKRQADVINVRIDALRSEIWEIAGGEFHLESTHQLGDVLFNKLGFGTGEKDEERQIWNGRDCLGTFSREGGCERSANGGAAPRYRVSATHQVGEHVPRATTKRREQRHRAYPCDISPTHYSDGTAGIARPEPAEYPGAHRGGPPDSQSVQSA